ncbi:MAG TPA: hypothetical protein VF641_10335 [Methylobacterium sp.]
MLMINHLFMMREPGVLMGEKIVCSKICCSHQTTKSTAEDVQGVQHRAVYKGAVETMPIFR